MTTGAIDRDIHPDVPDFRTVLPRAGDFWRVTFVDRGPRRVDAIFDTGRAAMMVVPDAVTRGLIMRTSTTKRRTDFIASLEKLDGRFGPKPGHEAKPINVGHD